MAKYIFNGLEYDSATGKFIWVEPRSRFLKPGDKAGCRKKTGYVVIKGFVCIGKAVMAHRVAWFMVHGHWPDCDIDHINGVRDDNRIDNLRLATRTQNSYNSRVRKNNKLGVKGVCADQNKFRAQIQISGHTHYLGVFDSIKEAEAVYQAAAKELHGEFYRE